VGENCQLERTSIVGYLLFSTSEDDESPERRRVWGSLESLESKDSRDSNEPTLRSLEFVLVVGVLFFRFIEGEFEGKTNRERIISHL